jgi:hypothetical protein
VGSLDGISIVGTQWTLDCESEGDAAVGRKDNMEEGRQDGMCPGRRRYIAPLPAACRAIAPGRPARRRVRHGALPANFQKAGASLGACRGPGAIDELANRFRFDRLNVARARTCCGTKRKIERGGRRGRTKSKLAV